MRRSRPLFPRVINLALILTAFDIAYGQAGTSATPNSPPRIANELPGTDPKLERKALALLEEVATQATALKLTDNQVRVQVMVGDMLWDRDASRARSLFNAAGAAVAQLMVAANVDRRDPDLASRLRRELVLTVVRHDAELAFQLLRLTRPLDSRRFNEADEISLEQNLISIVAAKDPLTAYRKIM